MSKQIPWFIGFLALYALHAVFYLSFTGRVVLPLPAEVVRIASMVTLIGLTLFVAAFIATRDEVMRRLAIISGAVSAIVTGFFSYGTSAFGVVVPVIGANFWAFAMLVFLFLYGILSWQARS